jgi:hypothetical protein
MNTHAMVIYVHWMGRINLDKFRDYGVKTQKLSQKISPLKWDMWCTQNPGKIIAHSSGLPGLQTGGVATAQSVKWPLCPPPLAH